jgi:RNA polymerase sigma-70 factor (ECF subfamily)
MIDTPTEDAGLVARAQGGCAASAAHLVEVYRQPIVDYLGRLLARGGPRARCDAEDVAQETFIRMLRGLDALEPGAAFSPWLFTIARRTCLNHLRSERRHARRIAARATVPDASVNRDGPLEAVVAAETRDRVWGLASRTLPKRQFTALWMRYVEEMPVAGIARAVGSTAAAVKLQLLRGRRRLEPALADAGCGPATAAERPPRRRTITAAAASAAGACIVAFWLAMSRTPIAPPPAPESFTIATLPLPDEIGERLVVETAAFAAEAVGLPRWEDVAVVDLATTIPSESP